MYVGYVGIEGDVDYVEVVIGVGDKLFFCYVVDGLNLVVDVCCFFEFQVLVCFFYLCDELGQYLVIFVGEKQLYIFYLLSIFFFVDQFGYVWFQVVINLILQIGVGVIVVDVVFILMDGKDFLQQCQGFVYGIVVGKRIKIFVFCMFGVVMYC